jgi:hypothetical protein
MPGAAAAAAAVAVADDDDDDIEGGNDNDDDDDDDDDLKFTADPFAAAIFAFSDASVDSIDSVGGSSHVILNNFLRFTPSVHPNNSGIVT